jgi:hypothetical protein
VERRVGLARVDRELHHDAAAHLVPVIAAAAIRRATGRTRDRAASDRAGGWSSRAPGARSGRRPSWRRPPTSFVKSTRRSATRIVSSPGTLRIVASSPSSDFVSARPAHLLEQVGPCDCAAGNRSRARAASPAPAISCGNALARRLRRLSRPAGRGSAAAAETFGSALERARNRPSADGRSSGLGQYEIPRGRRGSRRGKHVERRQERRDRKDRGRSRASRRRV